jgi:hypothetical protein
MPFLTPTTMTVVLDIMMENIGDLRVLDLSGNSGLTVPDILIALPLRFPKLRILHIRRNLVSDYIQKDHLYIIFQFLDTHPPHILKSSSHLGYIFGGLCVHGFSKVFLGI